MEAPETESTADETPHSHSQTLSSKFPRSECTTTANTTPPQSSLITMMNCALRGETLVWIREKPLLGLLPSFDDFYKI